MKLGLDVVHMPVARDGSRYMVGLRDDLSGWAEYRALRNADSRSVAKFIFESWISRYGCPMMIVNDGGPENQLLTKELLRRYNIRNVQVAAYHPQSNGLVERGHQNIVDALAKLTAPSRIGNWVDHLAAVRITVRRTTGMSPFRVVFAQECLLPVDVLPAPTTTNRPLPLTCLRGSDAKRKGLPGPLIRRSDPCLFRNILQYI
jgi:hypothetical protein